MGLNFGGGGELGLNSADYIQMIMILSEPVAGDSNHFCRATSVNRHFLSRASRIKCNTLVSTLETEYDYMYHFLHHTFSTKGRSAGDAVVASCDK
eukprot:scaffold6919_cov100-Skeletonema_dohrnii-CCMP3373.AAC.3